MAIAGILQMSLISKREWNCLFGKVELAAEKSRQFRRSSSILLRRMISSSQEFDDDTEVLSSKKED